jgi:hypothetical protein
MALGSGGDVPESYNRVFFEAYSDPALVYDPGALKFLVVLGDAPPHDPTPTLAPSCGATPPADPGRDETVGTGDDLETEPVIAGLNANNITLLMINYGGFYVACHEELAAGAGGDAFPGGSGADLSQTIVDAVAASGSRINEVHLVVTGDCPPVSITFNPPNPPPYGPYDAPVDIQFDEIITAPATPGDYTCSVSAVVDGAVRGVETVHVVVPPGTECPPDDDDDFDDDGEDNETDDDDDDDGEGDDDDEDDDNDGLVDGSDKDDDNDGEGDDSDDFDGDGFAALFDGDDDDDGEGDDSDGDDDNDGVGDDADDDDDNDGESDDDDDEDGDDDDDAADDCDTDDDDDGVDDGDDNCQELPNSLQDDQDEDGHGDECDDGDGDGFVDADELHVGTQPGERCSGAGWPANTLDTGTSASKLDIQDVLSFVSPVRRLGTSPGDAGFDARWDLMQGTVFNGHHINMQDITAVLAGSTGNPPMFGGGRAFGKVCTAP